MYEEITIYDLCIKTTGDFEGTGFDSVSNDFDGQGCSFGILQFGIGNGTFSEYILSQVDVTNLDYFPVSIRPLQYMDAMSAVSWCKDMFYDSKGKMKTEWTIAWKRFLTTPSIVNLQKRACDKYYHQAKCIAGKLGFAHTNKRAMVWSFDLAVQSWALKIDRPPINDSQCEAIISMYEPKNYIIWEKQQLTNDQKVLLIASHLRALKCKQEWRSAFFTRKATIALGIGWVNGKLYDLNEMLR